MSVPREQPFGADIADRALKHVCATRIGRMGIIGKGIVIKAFNLFVKALENEDVEFVFGVPDEENLDFLDSLSRSTIRLVLTRHEQAAGFMAATYGRLTGKAGVCLSTLGPGAANFVTAAAYARLGEMPMVMVTEQPTIRVIENLKSK